MANNRLSALAYSGSLLATTLFSVPSSALPAANPREDLQKLDRSDRLNIPDTLQTEDRTTPATYERRLQQAAFERYGCGCNGCVGNIRQLWRSGEINL